MPISRDEVEKVSRLARLSLSEEELDRMTGQMGEILGYMGLLSELDTGEHRADGPLVGPLNVFRDDVVQAGLDRGSALANAPRSDGECYLVPAVLAEEQ